MTNNDTQQVTRSDCTPWRDEDTLRHFYHGKQYSLLETAEAVGCTEGTVSQWCGRLDIETRDAQMARDTGTPEAYKDAERMRELYLTLEMTCAEIADEYGTTDKCVSDWLNRHNIPTRSANAPKKRVTRTCPNCRSEFETTPTGTKYCCQECYFEDLDMPTGPDHWSWNEDRRHMQNGELWNRIRQQCRRRDGYTCQICGEMEPDDQQHDVHHLTPVRYFEDSANAHTLGNVVTLCRSCHMQWEQYTPFLPCVVP